MPVTQSTDPVVDTGTGAYELPEGPITVESPDGPPTGAVEIPENHQGRGLGTVVSEDHDGKPGTGYDVPGPTTHYAWPAEAPKAKEAPRAEAKPAADSSEKGK